MKIKYGTWSKKPEITVNWNRTNYFINNRELYYSKTQIFPLKTNNSQKNICIILCLYALCDLSIENESKDYFNIGEIRNMIQKKLVKYKALLLTKGLYRVERVCKSKYRRCHGSYNYLDDFEKQKEELTKKIEGLYTKSADKKTSGSLIRVDDIYYSLAMLLKVFVNFRVYSRGKDYQNIKFENDYSVSRILYYLNDDGKELLKKYKSNYLF